MQVYNDPSLYNRPAFNKGYKLATAQYDKQIKSVLKTAVANSQVQTDLYTADRAVTILGIRWTLNFTQDAGTGIAYGKWAIVRVREGYTPNALSLADGSTSYSPEQDVLAFGDWSIDNNTQTKKQIKETTAKRKMQSGDEIAFIAMGVGTNTTQINGSVQFFAKE